MSAKNVYPSPEPIEDVSKGWSRLQRRRRKSPTSCHLWIKCGRNLSSQSRNNLLHLGSHSGESVWRPCPNPQVPAKILEILDWPFKFRNDWKRFYLVALFLSWQSFCHNDHLKTVKSPLSAPLKENWQKPILGSRPVRPTDVSFTTNFEHLNFRLLQCEQGISSFIHNV